MAEKSVCEVIVYQTKGDVRLEVLAEAENVWLNRQQLAMLFGRDVKTIGKHIANALREELAGFPVVAKFATTAVERAMKYVLDTLMPSLPDSRTPIGFHP